MAKIVEILPVLLLAWLAAARSDAQSAPHSYALVIGSNRGGSGQGTLTFAQRDAERMAELLTELGRTPRAHIARLNDPSASQVEQALARLRERLEAHAAAGEQAQLLFYYSGHARAQALSLGDEELSLRALRKSLLSLPSTLTIVVLDACQSGAFSGVKGASPAADFSVSSVQSLHSSGVAVMASSSGTELSQESRELGSSYFTHHLLVALRGAGDLDRDGRVSLDEAYGYAYERTLSDTARTQVGSQHATLETELTARGDVPLTYPVDADAQLALPATLEGRVLVQRAGRGAVVAELVKARGAQLLLALPSARYEVLVRRAGSARSCEVPLARGAVHTLQVDECRPLVLPAQVSKDVPHAQGAAAPVHPLPRESWFLEFGLATASRRDDAYVATLRTFDYDNPSERQGVKFGFDAALGVALHRYVQLVARGYKVESRFFTRKTVRGTDFEWTAHAVSAGPRLRLPMKDHWLVFFGELTAGMGFARSALADRWSADDAKTHVQRQRNYVLRAEAGLLVGFTRHFGAYLSGGWVRAPIVENALDQLHDSGGFMFTHGLRLNAVEGWW
jgi:hypothetical protein